MKKILKKIKDKLREASGETIVETLVSMLIVVLAFTMLAGAIVAAARVYASTEAHTLYLNEADGDSATHGEVSGATVTVGGILTGQKVKTYQSTDSSGILYYYE